MARDLTLGRTQAEALVDLLEEESIGWRLELADEIRRMFGMGKRD
jgi:hypothetical protein